MDIGRLLKSIDRDQAGLEMHRMIAELYPVCRSITGNGVRRTLSLIHERIPLEVHEVPSGTRVFDWAVPNEWNIRDGYVKDSRGERVVDFQASNLHVVGYSATVHARMGLTELKHHLHSLPDRPDWVPYRTSYYKEDWGFCLSHREMTQLREDTYEVCIDSILAPGHLTYGEHYLKGETDDEVLLSCHVCHPSLCNDNLSGIALVTQAARLLSGSPLRYSYRILFIPGTIGSITWLALNEDHVMNIKHGLVVAGVGDPGPCTYKRSRRGDAEVDRVAEHVLARSGDPFEILPFSPYGYDERQYCSPGFDLPVGCFQRTPFGRYPEYHTSGDNLDFVKPRALADALSKLLSITEVLERNRVYLNTNPKCEPQLGKRGLYGSLGGSSDAAAAQMAMLWVLNFSDGRHDLLAIAEKSGIPFDTINHVADLLVQQGLLKQAEPGETIGPGLLP